MMKKQHFIAENPVEEVEQFKELSKPVEHLLAEEMEQLKKLREEQQDLKQQIAIQSRAGEHEENVGLYKKQRDNLQRENLIEALLYRKESGSRFFLRKINYAFDIQKHEMFEYYKHQRTQLEENQETAVSDNEEDDNNDDNN